MASGPWDPPESERELGLGYYGSTTPPMDGVVKERPEEFRVRELSSYPMPDPEGAFTVLRVVSRGWEQHELGQRIAERLGLPPHALSWAGTKDRRAVTERLASYRGPPPAGPLGLRDVDLVESYRSRDGLVLGHHYGNVFTLRIGGLHDRSRSEEAIRAATTELAGSGGFPNLFGLQRFGEVRPVTHRVGRALVTQGAAAAIEEYLAWDVGGADSNGAEARRAYGAHHDAVRALKEFPVQFRFERQLLDHLARGHPPERALRALSRELRQLFVHAYQSLLFNRWLSARHAAGLSMTLPEPGDVLLRVARDGTVPGNGPIPVESDNLPEALEMARRGRARLAGPLVGLETPRPSGRPGELLERLLSEENVDRAAFRVASAPEVASRGSWRPALVPMPPVGVQVGDPERGGLPEGTDDGLWLTFALPKGAYATVLVREFLKTGASRAVG